MDDDVFWFSMKLLGFMSAAASSSASIYKLTMSKKNVTTAKWNVKLSFVVINSMSFAYFSLLCHQFSPQSDGAAHCLYAFDLNLS